MGLIRANDAGRLSLRFKDERLRALFTFQDLYVGEKGGGCSVALMRVATKDPCPVVGVTLAGGERIPADVVVANR